jgi:argininosuccinate lyase
MISPAVSPIAKCWRKVGVITDEEASQLVEGLGIVKRELDRGEFVFDDSLEDIHMHIEARLLQVAGKVAQKLHTARSRNDQVRWTFACTCADETRQVIELLQRLRWFWWNWPKNIWMWSCPVIPTPSVRSRSFLPTT